MAPQAQPPENRVGIDMPASLALRCLMDDRHVATARACTIGVLDRRFTRGMLEECQQCRLDELACRVRRGGLEPIGVPAASQVAGTVDEHELVGWRVGGEPAVLRKCRLN